MNAVLLIFWVGISSFFILVPILIFFHRLIFRQIKVWFLAKRGYYQIEHIGEDNIRRYYFLRPKGDHYDIDNGIYMFIPDCLTKESQLLEDVPNDLLKAKNVQDLEMKFFSKLKLKDKKHYADRLIAEREQWKKIYDIVIGLKFRYTAISLRYGIPTITYYGNNPNPVYFKQLDMWKDAKALKMMYLRILLTQALKELKKWLRILMFVGIGIGVILLIYFLLIKKGGDNLQATTVLLQTCQDKLYEYLPHNSTLVL